MEEKEVDGMDKTIDIYRKAVRTKFDNWFLLKRVAIILKEKSKKEKSFKFAP